MNILPLSPFSKKSYPFNLTQITLCYNAKKWGKLTEMILYLMNRRGQGKKAQIEMIQMAMTWLPNTAEPQRTTLIETIRDVCAKKIFLEVRISLMFLGRVCTMRADDRKE